MYSVRSLGLQRVALGDDCTVVVVGNARAKSGVRARHVARGALRVGTICTHTLNSFGPKGRKN